MKLFFLKSEWGFHGIPSGIPKIFQEFPKNSQEVPGIPKNRGKNFKQAKKEKKSQWGCYMQG